MVALVTPMSYGGEIDIERLKKLIEMHIAQGTSAIVLMGSTGEAATLSESERRQIIQIGIETAAGRIPIIVGSGTCSTAETIKRTRDAKALGVDACLIVTPYYNRPTQEGLYQHFRAIAETVQVPIILYNVPTRTGCDLLPETVQRLSEIPYIIGLKEAVGDMARVKVLRELCAKSMMRSGFALYSGDDPSGLAFMLQGGQGVISITANAAPGLMHDICAAALKNDFRVAGELNTRLMPLHKLMGIESNPIPIKWILTQLGWIEGGIRLPLTELSAHLHESLKNAMTQAGLA
jgi:4-hydroxy-tetrahydrodipicolinate synthase